jgi:hypothetical protein
MLVLSAIANPTVVFPEAFCPSKKKHYGINAFFVCE